MRNAKNGPHFTCLSFQLQGASPLTSLTPGSAPGSATQYPCRYRLGLRACHGMPHHYETPSAVYAS